MFAQALIELIGTFIFLSVILSTKGDAIAIGIALATAIFFGGSVSGGHFNPAVTFMQTIGGKMDYITAFVYVLVQLIGAAAALGFSKYVITH
jgi:aquaporin Z